MIWEFLSPYEAKTQHLSAKQLGSVVRFYNGKSFDISNYKVFILGINDSSGHPENAGANEGADFIRGELYKLFFDHNGLNICDLGNIESGNSSEDTRFAVQSILEELFKLNKFVIILGGDGSFLYNHQKAYSLTENKINIVEVNEKVTLLENEHLSTEQSGIHNYLIKSISELPNNIFNYTLLGYQSYLVNPDDISLLKKLHFESYRLGSVVHDVREIEPIVRDADMVVFNVSSLRSCDAPGYYNASPNGFFAHEACRITRYAGLSDRLSSFGIYDYNPLFDKNKLTAKTLAQMIWYLIEGIYNRKADYPILDMDNFEHYTVALTDSDEDMLFLKSKRSGRWWIKIPDNRKIFEKYSLFPCSYNDYLHAVKNEVPDRWLNAYAKMK